MIVLNEVTPGGLRRLELYGDDVSCVSNVPGAPGGAEIEMIDGRRFYVVEDVATVFGQLDGEDGIVVN